MQGRAAKPKSVCVVGGGVVGGFVAYLLAREGVEVSLLERNRLGSGASGASAGNVQTLSNGFQGFHKELGQESLGLYRRLLPSIKDESRVDPMDHEVRYLYAAMDEEQATAIQAEELQLVEDGMKAQWIDGQRARELEPRLSPRLLGGLLHSDCIQMDGTRLVNALGRAAQERGAYVAGSEVAGLELDGDRVTGVRRVDGTVLRADMVVTAMGAWTGPAISDWLGVSLPILPQSLQKIHLLTGDQPLECAVRWDGINMVSRRDGLTHIGSKRDGFGFDAHPTEEGRRWLLEHAATVFPGLEARVAEAWAGCAVATPEAFPVLGPLEGHQGICVATPSSNGFLLAPALAEILTSFLMKGEEHPLMEEMLPGRAVMRARGLTDPYGSAHETR
ncbi:MAG: FAD-binding oxidoreductase [Dehalococcoidia bacterium]|nr:FAD-binding oxidoreductase [Dehalococcoidia bacterium]